MGVRVGTHLLKIEAVLDYMLLRISKISHNFNLMTNFKRVIS
jgi:hypothetical protein